MRSCGMNVENGRRQRRAKKCFVFLKNGINISAARNAFMCDLCIEWRLRCVNLVK